MINIGTQQRSHRAQSFSISQALMVNQLEDVRMNIVVFFMRIPQMCPEKDGEFLWVAIISHKSDSLHQGV